MCLLFETIRVVNGLPQHMAWHEARMNQARKELWKSVVPLFSWKDITVPREYATGVSRCNIYYGTDIRKISFTKYEKRTIRSLKMVRCEVLDYHLKYADRSLLESVFLLRGSSDEIIVVKNGLITDTSMSNLIFFNGSNWVTPANPLLKGTCRARLLSDGWLTELDIRPEDLGNFTGCKLINAMRDPGEEALIPVSEIS